MPKAQLCHIISENARHYSSSSRYIVNKGKSLPRLKDLQLHKSIKSITLRKQAEEQAMFEVKLTHHEGLISFRDAFGYSSTHSR